MKFFLELMSGSFLMSLRQGYTKNSMSRRVLKVIVWQGFVTIIVMHVQHTVVVENLCFASFGNKFGSAIIFDTCTEIWPTLAILVQTAGLWLRFESTLSSCFTNMFQIL